MFYLVDLNYDCSVIVVDSYFVIRFKTSQVAEYVVYLSQTLRREWNSLMNLRISRGLGEVITAQGNIWLAPHTYCDVLHRLLMTQWTMILSSAHPLRAHFR